MNIDTGELPPLCDRCGEEIAPGSEKDGTGEWDGCTLCPLCYDDVLFEQQEAHLCKGCGGGLDDGGVCWECDIDFKPLHGESGKNLL